MLSKLLKYEFRATARTFLPLYGAVLAIALLNRMTFSFGDGFGGGMITVLTTLVYGSLMIALFVITAIVMIQRFYRNLLCDEGYLMFTLPVKSWQLIASKLISSLVWMLAAGVVSALSIMLIVSNQYFWDLLPDLWAEVVRIFREYSSFHGVFYLLGTLIGGLLEAISFILHIYAAIALGHLFMKRRVLASFGAYIGLNVVSQTVNSTVYNIIDIGNRYGNQPYTSPDEAFGMVFNVFGETLLPSILLSLLFCTAYFFIANYVLSNKLNLE